MISGVIFIVTGPVLAEYVTGNDMASSGAVWCFQSVIQTMMPFIMDCFEVYAPKRKGLMWVCVLAALALYGWNFWIIKNIATVCVA